MNRAEMRSSANISLLRLASFGQMFKKDSSRTGTRDTGTGSWRGGKSIARARREQHETLCPSESVLRILNF
ncbi:hypothetical protein GRJ2_001664400 [Grus japonensis]|uniref:Uncharacterized protein n=1 Tax=Grus japonensis TaxID=30415 RepID=A0ABC9X3H0_GRUJA